MTHQNLRSTDYLYFSSLIKLQDDGRFLCRFFFLLLFFVTLILLWASFKNGFNKTFISMHYIVWIKLISLIIWEIRCTKNINLSYEINHYKNRLKKWNKICPTLNYRFIQMFFVFIIPAPKKLRFIRYKKRKYDMAFSYINHI